MNTFYVANIILQHFIDKKEPIRNMKLQKLLYFSCGWYSILSNLKENNNWWLIEDDFYAYPYGPVCTAVYNEVKKKHKDTIAKTIENEGIEEDKNNTVGHSIIKHVIKKYGKYSDWDLSAKTHIADTPWSKTITNKGVGQKISREDIQEYYKEEFSRINKHE